ncbi:hypothetical protein DW962_15075 [Blautia sp. AM46-5]|nr:hypothetical protein DW962_15075 [Blautia sp. AM46-5]RHS54414.1 hypothetical protein DW961_15520 [Blautia sp. AM46-3MH]
MTKQQTDGRIFQIRGVMGHACFLMYASNEPKSVHARDLGDCRDNLRNSRSVFLIVYLSYKSESDLV